MPKKIGKPKTGKTPMQRYRSAIDPSSVVRSGMRSTDLWRGAGSAGAVGGAMFGMGKLGKKLKKKKTKSIY